MAYQDLVYDGIKQEDEGGWRAKKFHPGGGLSSSKMDGNHTHDAPNSNLRPLCSQILMLQFFNGYRNILKPSTQLVSA